MKKSDDIVVGIRELTIIEEIETKRKAKKNKFQK